MTHLAEIVEIYEDPLTIESNVRIDYVQDVMVPERVRNINIELEQCVDEERERLGLMHIRPINLPSKQAEDLRRAIKSNPEWADNFKEIVSLLSPELAPTDLKDLLDAIRVPWWVGTPVFRINDHFDKSRGTLNITGELSHTYITQLMGSKKFASLAQMKGAKDSMSVSGVSITYDNLLVLGWRGGHRYSNTIMTVPAGSVEGELFPTIYAEHFEELGRSRKDFSAVELVGRVYDNTIGNNSLYIFRSTMAMPFNDLLRSFRSSADQREHKYLLPLINDPHFMLDEIKEKGYDLAKADDGNPAATTMGNVGAILPPCAASLLLHFTQQEGKAWGRKAEQMLNGAYRFF
jgi:hypothetical protein